MSMMKKIVQNVQETRRPRSAKKPMIQTQDRIQHQVKKKFAHHKLHRSPDCPAESRWTSTRQWAMRSTGVGVRTAFSARAERTAT